MCKVHGETTFRQVGREKRWRCKLCEAEKVVKWRRNAKAKLVATFGGECLLCGYNRYFGALHFHHIDPSTKSFGLSASGFTRSFESLCEEAKKCVLLCANCHSEVEGNFVPLTDSSTGRTPPC